MEIETFPLIWGEKLTIHGTAKPVGVGEAWLRLGGRVSSNIWL